MHFFLLFLSLFSVGISRSQSSSLHYSGMDRKGNTSKNSSVRYRTNTKSTFIYRRPFRFGLFFRSFKNQTYGSLSSFRIPSAWSRLSYRRARLGTSPDKIFSFRRNVFLQQTISIKITADFCRPIKTTPLELVHRGNY